MIFRTIANPRRTTLAHLEDADELQADRGFGPGRPADAPAAEELPDSTANPRRTVLEELSQGA